MSYVDEEYYNSFSGTITEKLSSKLEKATDQINSLTYNRITGIGFDNLTPFQQDKIKKAICVHADFIEQYGPYIDMPLSGFTAGSTSISFNAQKINGVTTTQEVLNYLNSTGLSCRRL
jgi:hypothetical protein